MRKIGKFLQLAAVLWCVACGSDGEDIVDDVAAFDDGSIDETATSDEVPAGQDVVDDPVDETEVNDSSDQPDAFLPDWFLTDDIVSDEIPDEDADAGPWMPIPPKREQHGIWTVVWLSGTPYEMGYQHGQLLHDQIEYGIKNSQYVKEIKNQILIAKLAQVDKFVALNSYPDIVQECDGMVAAAGDVGWTKELCLFVNFGDVMMEILDSLPVPVRLPRPGCSQMMVTGAASADGRMYHGRILDWDAIDYLLWFPTIFVRQPHDGLPHVYIGFPGNLSPYSGMNVAGLSMASNETDPFDDEQRDYSGRSHVQMLGQLLKKASSLDEAIAFVEGETHMSVEQFGIADAGTDRAGVFEMTATAVRVREMEAGVLWMTNHFVHPDMKDLDKDPPGNSSIRRFTRFSQLLPPDGVESRYGAFSPTEVVRVLRDRVNPQTGLESPPGTFDDGDSLATNGAIYVMVFDPGNLHFWVAAGTIPVPEQQFTGFSLGTLLNWPGAIPVEPTVIP